MVIKSGYPGYGPFSSISYLVLCELLSPPLNPSPPPTTSIFKRHPSPMPFIPAETPVLCYNLDHPKKDQSCVTTMRPPPSCATTVLVWSRLDSPVMMLPVLSFPLLLADPVTRV
ncbi:hypothetical protein QQF64_015977 [Cirrhinus molitorella]|uniref:Uncharacterized protein n=1 Tax=Cirrhinus molitorella TaxID=172907 RepID=A0ABR3LLI5_9TELE